MLRAVLLGVMSFAVVPACGSKSDAPAVQPGAVAGKVLEVTGEVKVGTTVLVVGSSVKTDDVIDTGTMGSVVIELAHNQARWELGPNNKKKPTESLAWTAAKAEGSAALTAEQTSAAGRPAERSAADSTSSAPKSPPPSPTSPVSPAEAPTAQPHASSTRGGPSAAVSAAPAAKAPSAAGGGIHSAYETASPGTTSTDQVSATDAAGATAVKRSEGVAADKGTPAPAIDPLQSLASCLQAGSTITLKIHVANHVPAVSFVGAVDPTVQTCITTAAKKLVLSVESGDMQVSLKK